MALTEKQQKKAEKLFLQLSEQIVIQNIKGDSFTAEIKVDEDRESAGLANVTALTAEAEMHQRPVKW